MFSDAIQLSVAVFLGLFFFGSVYILDEKKIFRLLVAFIPFQVVDSKFGSLNFVLTVVFLVSVLGKWKYWLRPIRHSHPSITASFVGIVFAQLMSLTQAPGVLLVSSIFYIINFAGNFVLIILTVNLIENEDDLIQLIHWLSISLLLVVIYSFFQGVLGQKGFALMNIQELSMKTVRLRGDIRVVGPFSNTQSYVGFLSLMSFFVIYMRYTVIKSKTAKIYWMALLLATLGALVASNTRAGILSFILGFILILLFFGFSVPSGLKKSMGLFVVGTVSIIIAVYTVVNYTPYNILLERLQGTKIQGGEVDTRKGLIPYFLRLISQKPLFGHRPMLGLSLPVEGIEGASAPHNFYIYVLYTTGIFGFTFFMLFLFFIFIRLRSAGKQWDGQLMRLKSFPGLCQIIFIIFLIQQNFISFIRYETRDYQQFIFLLFGIFCSLEHIAGKPSEKVKSNSAELKV